MKATGYLLAAAALLGSRPGWAQQVPAPTLYRFRVGLQTASHYYSVFYASGSRPPQSLHVTPAMLSLGYAFTPRLMAQAGVVAGRDVWDDAGSIFFTPGGQRVVTGITHDEQHWLAAPLLLRYALLPPPRRLQFDALAGLTYFHAAHSEEARSTTDGLETMHSYAADRTAHLYATLGLGVRYHLGRHLEAVGDLTWTRNLHPATPTEYRQATANRLGITHGTNIGLRYRFNFRRPCVSG